MIQKYRPDLIRCKACIPDLIAILRTPEPNEALTGDQIQAGYAIAANTGKDFHFNPCGGHCGNAALTAAQIKAITDKCNVKLLAERRKVMEWWDSGGSKEFEN